MRPPFIFSLSLALAGLLLASCRPQTQAAKPGNVDYYTCTMHPSVRSQDPKGKCPICSMELVPVLKKTARAAADPSAARPDSSAGSSEEENPSEFTIPPRRQQQFGVTYAVVGRRPFQHSIRAVGTVAYDKSRHWDYVARVDGYVRELFVFSRGETVAAGAPLLSIYSPELLATQSEFADLLRVRDENQGLGNKMVLESTERLLDSARRRLQLWNISPEEIRRLETSREPREFLTLYSPFRGVAQNIAVDQGRKVMSGDHLVDVADLSVVWVWTEFYQDELPWLTQGDSIVVATSSYPGEKFPGRIQVIDPFINDATRTGRVRIELENPGLKLRPDMYVDVEFTKEAGEHPAVPVEAVLPTGRRNIVFQDKGDGRLQPRFVELGPKMGGFYEIKEGLQDGDRVVTSGNFLIDAEAKVQGALKSW